MVITALLLAVGFFLMILWPAVSSVGRKIGGGLKSATDKAATTAQASTQRTSASEGLM